MTPNEMTQQLVAAGRSLIDVLDQESTALSSVQLRRVEQLREDKEDAAARYEAALKQAKAAADQFVDATPADRQALSTMKEALDTAAIRNINALRAALEMNRRLVDTIAASINRQRVSATGYTKTGAAYGKVQGPKSTETVPVSLNETL